MNQGLIGNWSPGIGDPSIGGWLTVLLYAAAAWATLRLLLAWNRNTLGAHMSTGFGEHSSQDLSCWASTSNSICRVH